MKHDSSRGLFRSACKCLVGGVNSPVRAFKAVGGSPVFIKSASGSKICDEDNNRYIDYVMSWGALILGHADPRVVAAVRAAAGKGLSFGAPTQEEIALAQMIIKAMPSMEKVRLVSSGTEAVMSALRLARGFTGRSKVIKFEGCYHGHSDSMLVKAGSGAATFGTPDSLGVPAELSRQTIVLKYNDTAGFGEAMRRSGKEIACVIIEPVAANMGVVMPRMDFLSAVRKLTEKAGSLLVFDEVITGFRFTYGGVQSLFGIVPDLTCLGKIIGGGMPLAAYGGRKEIMDRLSPLGGVYQAGTLSGNPVAVASGLATLRQLAKADYARLNTRTAELCRQMEEIAAANRCAVRINRCGSLFTVFFTGAPVTDYATAKASDVRSFARFFWKMACQGIYLAPSQFEANFVSLAHSAGDMDDTAAAFAHAVGSKGRCHVCAEKRKNRSS
jgi:glutamate-1-semialdehyde 2,1-aminomutase